MKRNNRETNYRKRLALLKSGLPRLVVRKTNSMITGQIIEYGENGDKTTASVYSKDLSKYGWALGVKNIPAAYLTGFLLAKKAKSKEAILDKGNRTLKKDSFIYYFVKGAQDGGINTHAGELPISEDRLYGLHIVNHYEKKTGNQFKSLGEKVKNIREEINKVLEKIAQNGK
ncbi:MAG: 50S ribosomal protein L18 [Candidatus Parvarchaeota archaeon]|nr:50S ribosomal protein L18 [Candidatus Parvarchaeota archaeon]